MRGTGLDHLLDLSPCTLRILHDLVCPEPGDLPALALHGCRSSCISSNLESVMITVHLDHQLARYAGEVCEIGTDGMLASKLRAAYASVA